MKNLYLFILLSCLSLTANSQCSFTSTGANPYTVSVEITPTSLNVPGSCPWGYNYTVNYNYTITFTGTPPSSNLYNLNGTLGCGSNTHSFTLPRTNSSNSGSGTTNGQWRGVSDCSTATPASLGCNKVSITISGPNMSNQSSSCTATPLPVELVSFTVQPLAKVNLLEWETASELNNDFFSVEYSENGIDFEEIGTVHGNGTTNEISNYRYAHNTSNKKSYYRLKQTDFDGAYEYSDIILANNVESESIAVWPNPSKGRVTIHLDEYVVSEVQILALDGRNVWNEVDLISQTGNQMILDISNLSEGVYSVIIPNKTVKLIKF